MKRKYFYYIGLVFLAVFVSETPISACCKEKSKLSDEDLAAIQKIKEHNELQKKNTVSLEKYQKENPNSMTPQPDEYWDMAWHARLADYGDEESQYVIAQAYDKGIQVDSNPRKAVAFYEKACDNGHVDSCMRLGEIYVENKWVQTDKEKSLYWYTKAGKTGYTQAQLKVSEIYKEKGDYIAAVKWLESGLKKLFPESEDLEHSAPQLRELRRLAAIQAKMEKRGVKKTVLHESVLTSFVAQKLKKEKSVSSQSLQTTAKSRLKPFHRIDAARTGGKK